MFVNRTKRNSKSSKLTVQDFIKEVKNRLSIHNKKNVQRSSTAIGNRSLNVSTDADYEFYNSDDDDDSSDEDDEMKENMRRLVEKEKDDEGLCDSGYSESFSSKSTMFDHSYSKPLQSLCQPQSKRESKGNAALLSLADAASKELENLSKDTGTNNKTYIAKKDVKSSFGSIKSF